LTITNILQISTEFSIIGQGLDITILLSNAGARRVYGYEPDEVLTKAKSSTLHTPEDVEARPIPSTWTRPRARASGPPHALTATAPARASTPSPGDGNA
jgi:PAS domain-containing protein